MKNKYWIYGLICWIGMTVACTDEIELPPVEPILVGFGLATNNGLQINLSESISKTALNIFPKVNDADVRVEDRNGASFRLLNISEGNYVSAFQAILGESYELIVEWKDEEYRAIAQMPEQLIEIDSAQHEVIQDSSTGVTRSRITLFFRDPPQTPTYGLLSLRFDGNLLTDTLFTDANGNGEYYRFQTDLNFRLNQGLIIEAEMAHFETALFEYLQAINQLNPDGAIGGLTVAPPSNVVGNISNDGFGFFGASASSNIEILIE